MRILFSRYAVSALFILLELLLLIGVFAYAYTYSALFVILSSVISALVFISLINRDINPEFKLTWLAVGIFLPVFGGLLYIICYSRRMSKSETRLSEKIAEELDMNAERTGDNAYSLKVLDNLSKSSANASGRALALMHDDKMARLFYGGDSVYYSTGAEFYSAMLADLDGAERYIFIEYFIVAEGRMWQGMLDILAKKAEQGVKVKMLYDDFGSMKTLSSDFDRKMRALGIECYRFARLSPVFKTSHNNRDHRKICVVDGRVAYTGGVNISDEYINGVGRFGYWKDGGIAIRGIAARGFARLFLSLFDMTRGKISDFDEYFDKIDVDNLDFGEKKGYFIPFGSGPAPAYGETVGKNAIMNIIGMAERYLYITTPYLIIDYDLTEALCNAARRGVDVRIITPGIPDKKIIKIMTKSSYPRLISAGVRIFEYAPGFIHEKLIIADDKCGIVSTINMDYRSLVHHFEDGLWIYGDSVLADIRNSFLKTERRSPEVLAENAKLGIREKIARDVMRIFAPLL